LCPGKSYFLSLFPIQKLLDCGNPEKMGFALHRCMFCGETRTIVFSCRSCFCLSWAKPYMDRWADFIGRRLLPGVTQNLSRKGCRQCWCARLVEGNFAWGMRLDRMLPPRANMVRWRVVMRLPADMPAKA